MFQQEQLIMKKDNIIKTMQTSIDELKKINEDKGIKVIERYILEPSEWNMKF